MRIIRGLIIGEIAVAVIFGMTGCSGMSTQEKIPPLVPVSVPLAVPS